METQCQSMELESWNESRPLATHGGRVLALEDEFEPMKEDEFQSVKAEKKSTVYTVDAIDPMETEFQPTVLELQLMETVG